MNLLLLRGGPDGDLRQELGENMGFPEQWTRTMFISPSGHYEGMNLGDMLMYPADDEIALHDLYQRLFVGEHTAGYCFVSRLEGDKPPPNHVLNIDLSDVEVPE